MDEKIYYEKMETFDFIAGDSFFSNVTTGRNLQDKEVFYFDSIKLSHEMISQYPCLLNFLGIIKYDGTSNAQQRILSKTIGIDYKLLNDNIVDEIVDLYNLNVICGIRLLPEGTALNSEIYEKFKNKNLDNDFCIMCDSCEVDCRFDLRLQKNISKIEKVEVYNKENRNFEVHNNIHINRELTADELKEIVKIANEKEYDNIFFNFYDPSYYEDALLVLKNNGLNSNVNITLLANPLYDMVELYSNLGNVIDNNINIHYNTCNDLNEYYKIRSSELQNYYSDIEASEICKLDEYINMLNFILEVENNIEEKKYSDLEKVSFVYDYFKKKYIYDPDYQQNPHSVNADLHLVSQKDRMICEGFSNLLSCVLRRSGIMCFTVGTDNHQYNIIKILDSKYDVDNIALLDVTWDIGDDKAINNNYDNFFRPLDATLHDWPASTLNIASSLFVSDDDYNRYYLNSNPGYITDAFGYAQRMLELMGLLNPEKEYSRKEIRSALINSGLGNMIQSEKLNAAINEVRKAEGDSCELFYDSLNNRGYSSTIPIIRNNGESDANNYIAVNVHIPDKNVTFDKVNPQNKILFPPKRREKFENFKDYLSRIKMHFHNMFYSNGVVLTNDLEEIETELENSVIEESKEETVSNVESLFNTFPLEEDNNMQQTIDEMQIDLVENQNESYNDEKNTFETIDNNEFISDLTLVTNEVSNAQVDSVNTKVEESTNSENYDLSNLQISQFKNYYKILGVKPGASMNNIRKAYDREYDSYKQYDKKVKELREALNVLCYHRKEYDDLFKKMVFLDKLPYTKQENLEEMIEIPYWIWNSDESQEKTKRRTI